MLSAKIRKDFAKKTKNLRKKGILPGVLYGPGIKNLSLEVDLKEFEKIYQQAGESSLISLEIDAPKNSVLTSADSASTSGKSQRAEKKKFLVLIYDLKSDPITNLPVHVDFFQPRLDEEITAVVPLVFEGEARACKDLGGTLIKNIQEVEVKALPQKLPHEIKISIDSLNTFEDNILIKDLTPPEGVKILKDPDEIITHVLPLEKIEEELEKPVEEKVEEVEKVEKAEEEEKEEKEREEKQ